MEKTASISDLRDTFERLYAAERLGAIGALENGQTEAALVYSERATAMLLLWCSLFERPIEAASPAEIVA